MFDDETIDYFVVVNDEEQYSIWPARRDLPTGWRAIEPARSREECLNHIEQVWTDMRPKSVREAMERQSVQ
ncbi:MbtH family protein [Saccharopolyspora shandongensis]|uniref:MbtH protein n=1 Tax=Saccharopolyspora shandongensis TaxID=418495 RepID=A0A1H3BAF2_9PSEU|nr:MbtH family NRPS accessory protein [Saccharopolyspora shandongensis]SDX38755.1 MbtH protein [Saccharopolyspora shandongensis]